MSKTKVLRGSKVDDLTCIINRPLAERPDRTVYHLLTMTDRRDNHREYPGTRVACHMSLATRPISWLKPALRDFQSFPVDAQTRVLDALTIAAAGGKADIAKPLKGLGSGVMDSVQPQAVLIACVMDR